MTKLVIKLDMPDGVATSEIDYAKCFTCMGPLELSFCQNVVEVAVENICGGKPMTKPCNTEAKINNLVAALGTNPRDATPTDLNRDLPKVVSCNHCLVHLEDLIVKYIP